jgi:indole-3-glycerol phosphate synthase
MDSAGDHTHDYIGPHPRNQTESGIASRQDVLTVQRAGASAILVGESLLKAGNVGRQIDSLLGRCGESR